MKTAYMMGLAHGAACVFLLLTASCSREIAADGETLQRGLPVCFQVSGQDEAALKGETVDTEDVMGTSLSSGVGLFAFHQEGVNGQAASFSRRTYVSSSPDFMSNQKVGSFSNGTWRWSYSPLKYWPNNSTDRVSFFAYAPYSQYMTWEAMGVTSDAEGSEIRFSHAIAENPRNQTDWLWAAPQLNLSNVPYVGFTFRHVLSRVVLYVGVDLGSPSRGIPSAWTVPNAQVRINSVVLTNLHEKAVAVYDALDGSVSYEGSGSQRVTMNRLDHFEESAYLVNASNYGTVDLTVDDGYRRLNLEDCCLFLSPQDLTKKDVEAIISYTVTVEDPVNPANSSRVDSYIRKRLYADSELAAFEAGRTYRLRFLIPIHPTELSYTTAHN